MSIRSVERAIKKKVMAGLRAAATTHAQLYLSAVTEFQTTPIGSHRAHGEIWNGQVVERSQPGEYPRKEFDEANKGIKTVSSVSKLEARSGVTEEGMPLVHLSEGFHPSTGFGSGDSFSGLKYDRLGMKDIFHDNFNTLASAAEAAIKTEPGQ